MPKNIFTMGIEPGGLTTGYEIRMVICYLLYEADMPITMKMLNDALLKDGLVNYFELASEVSHLVTSGHIVDTEKNEDGETLLILTEKGTQTALEFYKDVSLSVREKALSSLKEAMTMKKNKSQNRCSIQQTENGVRLDLSIADYGSDLLHLNFYLPTEGIAAKCRDNFLKDPTFLYRAVVKALSGEDVGN